MSESVKTFDGEIKEILTPLDSATVETVDFIEHMVYDDPNLKIETSNKNQLERLNLDFIGWTHTPQNAAFLVKYLAQTQPDILIIESGGATEDFRKKQEIVDNLIIRGVPVLLEAANGQTIDVLPAEELSDAHEHFMPAIMRSLWVSGTLPVIRKMDMSEELAKQHGVKQRIGSFEGVSEIVGEPYWYMDGSPDELMKAIRRGIVNYGRQVRSRENTMVSDVSRICANALSKLEGEVKVAVCFGSSHTPVARYFQRQGLSAELHFLAHDGEVKKSASFSPYLALSREASLKKQVSDKLVKTFALNSIIAPRASAGVQTYKPELPKPEARRRANEISCAIIQSYGDLILASWRDLSKKKFRKSAAQKEFEQLLAELIYEKI